MSNTLTGLIPNLYEALDTLSHELIGFIPAVRTDTQVARAAKGQVVVSAVAPPSLAADITPGVTAPNDGDQVIGNMQLTINKSRYVPIRWNGEEQRGLDNNGAGSRSIMTDQFAEAFRTLVNEVETDIAAAAYKAASRAYGTPGTAPFGTAGDLSDAAQLAMILDDNGAPISNRQMVLGSAAMANIRGKQSVLFKVNESGTDDLLRKGIIGELEGFYLHNSPGVKPVVKGSGTGYLVNNGAGYAIGATAITVDTGSGTILAGDSITFAGDTNKYVVVSALAANVVTIGAPGLRAAVADNTAITVGNSFTPNLGFAKNALVLATRIPAVPVDASGNAMDMADDRTIVTDPYSGISFEVALYRQYRQIKYEIGLAWGTGAVKQEHIAVLLG
jgi:hypothetical protein